MRRKGRCDKHAVAVAINAAAMLVACFVPLREAVAQPYPQRPLRLIVPFAAGGSIDVLGRLIAQGLADRLGQTVVVDNRVGAGGDIGSAMVARAAPDGYTLLFGGAGHLTITPSLGVAMGYTPMTDLAPIGMVASIPNVLVVPVSSPAKTPQELIALAKTRPGKLTFASGGQGGVIHLAGELLKQHEGLNILHVPYKGSPPALLDLIAGRVDLMFDLIPTSLPHIRGAKLRALGVAGQQRSPDLAQVPTLVEQGLAYYRDVASWSALFAPTKTPRDIVAQLARELTAIVETSAAQKQIRALGADVRGSSPEELAQIIAADTKRWAAVIAKAGIKTERD